MCDNSPLNITSIDEALLRREELNQWCVDNPNSDHIVKIPGKQHSFCTTVLRYYSVIAGSFALRMFLDSLADHPQLDISTWISNDIDVFFLDYPERSKTFDKMTNIDIVTTTYKNVTSLLLNFDLPIVRVALDHTSTFHISLQALNAIITNKIILSGKLQCVNCASIEMHRRFKSGCEIGFIYKQNNKHLDNVKYWGERFHMRIAKYEKRGYSVKWIDTNSCDHHN